MNPRIIKAIEKIHELIEFYKENRHVGDLHYLLDIMQYHNFDYETMYDKVYRLGQLHFLETAFGEGDHTNNIHNVCGCMLDIVSCLSYPVTEKHLELMEFYISFVSPNLNDYKKL